MSASHYAHAIIKDGPWGFYKTAETTGTTLADSSGNGRDLTITGSPTLAQLGPDGAADNAIDWPSSAGPGGTYGESDADNTILAGTATGEAWVYLTEIPSASTGILGCSNSLGGSQGSRQLWIDSSGHACWAVYSGGWRQATSDVLDLNVWHHVVGSTGSDGTKIRVDKSAASVVSGTSAATTSDNRLYLHGGANNSRGAFQDSPALIIATAAWFTSQLSDAQTDAHYDAMFTGLSGVWGWVG